MGKMMSNLKLTKIEVLKNLSLGERVAEDEGNKLENYFVQTDQWDQMFNGKKDIIYGPKGTGKSALYSLLNRKTDELRERNVILASAENVRGATVFKGLVSAPPPNELSFIFLWKLYCLVLIGKSLQDSNISNKDSSSLISALHAANLLPPDASLATLFRFVQTYFKQLLSRDTEAVEHSISIDPSSGLPIVTRRVELRDSPEVDRLASVPVDELLEIADRALKSGNSQIWILFDRLDVAFAESRELERNALRALFRAYSDLRVLNNIFLKIFVRDDIWNRVSSGGFSEASHITKTSNITWSEAGLLNLIAKRLLTSPTFIAFMILKPDSNEEKFLIQQKNLKATVETEFLAQQDLIKSILPDKVDTGKNPTTFEWMVSRVRDGLGVSAPRELIHMFEVIKDLQIKRLERGESEPDGQLLFDRIVFKEALDVVSKVRYSQTFIAEYPEYQKYTNKLQGEKAEHDPDSLSRIWETTKDDAEKIADELVTVGFFERRGSNGSYTYWVPFLYRGALNLIQGKA